MEERHEIIQFDSQNPVKLFMHKLGDVSRHWHGSMEILFVLAGSVNVYHGDSGSVLQKDDVLLINSNTIHELHSEDCVLIAVQINPEKFGLDSKLTQNLFFNCNSSLSEDKRPFTPMKQIIASMLQTGSDKSEVALFRNRTLAFSLMTQLIQNFRSAKPSMDQSTEKYLDRLTSIVSYINEHYAEQLTLSQLSEEVHLSVPYLSSFFEKYMGMNFSVYYTDYRLEKATQQLIRSDESIEVIARNNGFSDPRSFTRAFRKKYSMLPSEYRKNTPTYHRVQKRDPLLSINYLDFKPENYFQLLSSYLPEEAPDNLVIASTKPSSGTADAESICVDVKNTNATPLFHKWKTTLCVGRAKELLQADIQDMVRKVQKEIGFRYVRFHGIFSDDMLVCKRIEDGSLRFSFVLTDKLIDFLLSVGLKPVIQLSFMPKALAKDPEKTVFDSAFIISPPKDIREWNLLVQMFLEHCVRRYGKEEVATWPFTIWNEPDTSEKLFGFSDNTDFFILYKESRKTIKNVDPDFKVGSPSLFLIDDSCFRWTKEFLQYAKKNHCMPEFIDCHYYSNDFSNFRINEDALLAQPVSSDPDYFKHQLNKIRSFLTELDAGSLPLYISEWNFSTSHRSLLNDTCFKGCYVAKNYLENYDEVESIGYWSLTDLLEESQPEEILFHGGMGLFTQNGIPKPPYHVMKMMSQLGPELLSRGDGYFITRKNAASIQILLYNYEHCDPLLTEEGLGLTFTKRDGVFPNQKSLNVSIDLTNLDGGKWKLRQTVLNCENGSCFDLWVAMGAAEELEKEDISYLIGQSEPSRLLSSANVSEGTCSIRETLLPHEVRLIELQKN